MKRAKIKAKSLASRITGFSIPLFGVSWQPPEPESDVVRDVVTALEDKRALYSQAVWEEPQHVVKSVLNMRELLTEGLKRVGDDSPAKQAFRIMRQSCRDFLSTTGVQRLPDRGMLLGSSWEQERFFIELGKLRGIFGQQLATLCYLYGIDVEEQLATILPPEPKDKE